MGRVDRRARRRLWRGRWAVALIYPPADGGLTGARELAVPLCRTRTRAGAVMATPAITERPEVAAALAADRARIAVRRVNLAGFIDG